MNTMSKRVLFVFNVLQVLQAGLTKGRARLSLRILFSNLPEILKLSQKDDQFFYLFAEFFSLLNSNDYSTAQKFKLDVELWLNKFVLWKSRRQTTLGRGTKRDKSSAQEGAISGNNSFSIVTPVYGDGGGCFEQTCKSVEAQQYKYWKWYLFVDTKSRVFVEERVSRSVAKKNIEIVYCKNLEDEFTSELKRVVDVCETTFVMFLSSSDRIYENSIGDLNDFSGKHSDASVFYSDEVRVTSYDQIVGHFYKPTWSLDLAQATNYIENLLVCRTLSLQEPGCLDGRFENDLKYNFVLRMSEKGKRIVHFPKVLYGQFVPKSTYAASYNFSVVCELRKIVLQAHLERLGIDAEVKRGMFPGSMRVQRRLMQRPLVSIIIPTKDKVNLLKQCVGSIDSLSTYHNFEIIIIDNNSEEPETLEYLSTSPHKVLRYPQKFNYSKINNVGAQAASGDYFLFLNNDTEVITPDWLEGLLEHAQREEVGIVGAKLLYPDGLVQHAGVVVDESLNGVHTQRFFEPNTHGYQGLVDCVRDLEVVTGACLMIRRQVFEQVSGFDEGLEVTYNDVDLCLKVKSVGYLIIYTPYSQLFHYEGISRWSGRYNATLEAEMRFFKDKWRETMDERVFNNTSTFI